MQTFTGNALNGGSNIPTSPVPYIKNEPLGTPPDQHRRFPQHGFPDTYVMTGNGAYHQQPSQFGQNYDSIDPSTLAMSPNPHDQPRNVVIQQNGGFAQSYGQNFNGTAFLTTDELLSLDIRKGDGMDGFDNGDGPLTEYDIQMMTSPGVVPGNGAYDPVYSQTPDNTQCDSPFTRPYHQQFRSMQTFNGAGVESPSSYNSHMSR